LDHTLEVELSGLGYDADFVEVYGELGGSETLQARMKEEIESDNFESWLGRIERVGKGRFAQRFAGKITADKIPNYIKAAVQRITGEDA
jgi:putative ATP-dependent endonuclease of OLD family